MLEELLSTIFTSQWMVLVFSLLLLMAATELGFRFALRVHRANDEARRAQVGGIQAAVLGLLALLLGFTFALSVARYETRRTLIVDEANAIGTTYLRADFLPDVQLTAVKELLRKYVDARLEYFDAGKDRAAIDAAIKKSTAIQRELWSEAVKAADDAPTPIVATFITALNETIDLDGLRLNALRTHVPGAVWLIVLLVAACGCYLSGYAAGTSAARTAFSSCLLPFLIAAVIALIVDLDHPRGGLIQIKQQPLVDLRGTMKQQKP